MHWFYMLRAELGKFLRIFWEELEVKINGFEIFRPVAPIDPAMRSMMTSLKALLFLLAWRNVNSMKVFTLFATGKISPSILIIEGQSLCLQNNFTHLFWAIKLTGTFYGCNYLPIKSTSTFYNKKNYQYILSYL